MVSEKAVEFPSRRARQAMGFVPIQLRDYVRRYLRDNRGEAAEEVTARLQSALEAYKAGARCDCGAPIWVIGSAETGNGCFTCITGERQVVDGHAGNLEQVSLRPHPRLAGEEGIAHGRVADGHHALVQGLKKQFTSVP